MYRKSIVLLVVLQKLTNAITLRTTFAVAWKNQLHHNVKKVLVAATIKTNRIVCNALDTCQHSTALLSRKSPT